MQIRHDPEVDALYIRLVGGAVRVTTQRLTEDVAVNYAPDGSVVGIEILDASENVFGAGGGPRILLENVAAEVA